MHLLPKSLQKLIAELSKLPSVGSKSAIRLAFHLSNNPEHSRQLAEAIGATSSTIKHCQKCFFITEADLCSICQDSTRDKSIMCIVEKPADLIAIERVGGYKGQYHILNGLWSPLKGQGIGSLHLDEMLKRIQADNIKEVIIATGSTVEGDATALYLARFLSENGIKTSRLAQGLPKGGDLEYLDDLTLSRAMDGRVSIE